MTSLYGEVVLRLMRERPDLDVAVPVAPNMAAELREALAGWPMTPRLLSTEEKFAGLPAGARRSCHIRRRDAGAGARWVRRWRSPTRSRAT